MPQKFQLGDVVECEFVGELEGVRCTVRKRLFVQGVSLNTNLKAPGHTFTYTVCERNPLDAVEIGRHYIKNESDLIELEPVVQEIEKAKSVMQKQLTGHQVPSLLDDLDVNGLASSSDPSSRALRSKCC